MHDYPPFDTLDTAPDFLRIGNSAMRNLEMVGWLATRTPLTERDASAAAARAYDSAKRRERQAHPSSIYVGVSKRGAGWAASSKQHGRYVRGPVRRTELRAAQDYAKATGTDVRLR